MRTLSGSKALNKFQAFERSQYFSPDLSDKNSLIIKFYRKEE